MFSSVQFSHSVMFNSFRPHESQHTRSPCPSPTCAVYSNSYPLSPWCHAAITSSIVLSPPAPNPSQHQGIFLWINSSHELAIVLEVQLQPQSVQWTLRLISFRMDWLDHLAVQGTLKSLLQHHSSKVSIFSVLSFFTVQLSHPHMTTGKTITLNRPN